VQQGICAQSEIASQDARLNKAYQQVMRQLAKTPDKRLALRTEQRSWLKARDYECKVDQETISSSCLVTKTNPRKRTGTHGPLLIDRTPAPLFRAVR
jgi:uncharacterized protein YecT (DUF1311 family)